MTPTGSAHPFHSQPFSSISDDAALPGNGSLGIIIGKFLPPHRGHEYLVNFAASFVDNLWIFVCSLPSDPIPGSLRAQWMHALFPAATISHIEEENPAANRNQPGAQGIWADAVLKRTARRPDYVFASEEYGWKFAKELGARFVPVDPSRDQFPISGTELRAKPFRHWHYLPAVVRPFFVREIMIDAPECGQDQAEEIIQKAAMLLNTLYVPVYSRFYQGFSASAEHPLTPEAKRKAQNALIAALKSQARCFLLRSSLEAREMGECSHRPHLLVRLDFGTAGRLPDDTVAEADELINLPCTPTTAAHCIRDAAIDRFNDWF